MVGSLMISGGVFWPCPAANAQHSLVRVDEAGTLGGFIFCQGAWDFFRASGSQEDKLDGRVGWDAIFIEPEARGRLAGGEARLGEREPPHRDGLTVSGPGLRPGRARERRAWS